MKNINSNGLADAPVLAEIYRGEDHFGHPIIETVHRGLVCVIDGRGDVILSMGDISTPVHMRSCAKPFQVLPLLETGAFDDHDPMGNIGLQSSDLALFMGSHAGETFHTKRVSEILHAARLSPADLRCGKHPPQNNDTKKLMTLSNVLPNELHNNCSGKHTAMLLTCQRLGFDVTQYEDPNHPLQQLIKANIAVVADLALLQIDHGIDGCSLPSFVIPLKNLALMYARLALWPSNFPSGRASWQREAFTKIWHAATNFPENIAGTNCFDTVMMTVFQDRMLCKTGADGLQAFALKPSKQFPHGLGIIIKIADGDHRKIARPLVSKSLLSDFGLWPNEKKLDALLPSFSNYRGLKTGGALNKLKKHH